MNKQGVLMRIQGRHCCNIRIRHGSFSNLKSKATVVKYEYAMVVSLIQKVKATNNFLFT